MRKCFLLGLPALLLTAPASISAQVALPGCTRPATITAPFAFVAVNGLCTDLSTLIMPVVGGDGWNLSAHLSLAGSTIDLRAIFNPDPSVTFSGTTTNLTNTTSSYAFFFGLPIVPDFYTSAISTANLAVTSVTGTTTVANSATYPAYLSGFGTLGGTFTNLDVELGTTPCMASGTPGAATCDQGSASNTFAPTFYDNLEALFTYTQDNALSTVAFTGDVTISSAAGPVTTTPEPATFALVGVGLVVLGGTRRRRRRPS